MTINTGTIVSGATIEAADILAIYSIGTNAAAAAINGGTIVNGATVELTTAGGSTITLAGTITGGATGATGPAGASVNSGTITSGGSLDLILTNGSTVAVVGSVVGGGGSSINSLPTVTTTGAADLVGISQSGTDHAIAWSSVLSDFGLTIGQGVPAGTSTGTDLLWINQGGTSDVVQTLSAIAAYVNTTTSPTAQIITNTTLSGTDNSRTLLAVTPGVTITAGTLTDGFRCELINWSGGTITLDSNIIPSSGNAILGDKSSVNIRATTAIGGGGTLSVLALSGGVSVLAPGAPGTITQGATGTTTMNLTWSAPTSGGAANQYLVQTSPTGANTWTTFATQPSSPSVILTGLAISTGYDIRVAAQNSGGTSAWSPVLVNAMTAAALTAPGSVTGLSEISSTGTTVDLAWVSAATGSPASSWAVTQRTPSGSGTYVASAGTFTSTGGTVTGLVASSTYDFQVVATNTAGSSAPTTITAASTLSAPGAVTSLAAGAVTSTTIPLTWSAGTGGAATSWAVTQRTPSGSGSYVASTGTFTGAGGTVTGLTSGVSYDFEVVATNSVGSSTAATLTNVSTPAVPTLTFVGFSSTVPAATNTASYTFANGAPASITATEAGTALTISGITITTTSGSGATAAGTASFTFTNPAAGTYAIVASGTGTYASTASSESLVTAYPPPPTYTAEPYQNYGITNGGVAAYAGNGYATVPNGGNDLTTITASSGNITTTGTGLTQITSGGTALIPTGVSINFNTSSTVPPPNPVSGGPNGLGTTGSWQSLNVFNSTTYPGVWGYTSGTLYVWGGPVANAAVYVWVQTSDRLAAGLPPFLMTLSDGVTPLTFSTTA